MSNNTEFKSFVMDQLGGFGEFGTKNMFGSAALLREGLAFAKVKHCAFSLKVDDSNRDDFLDREMPQYTYGKDNSRWLNFFMTPPESLDDAEALKEWTLMATKAATK